MVGIFVGSKTKPTFLVEVNKNRKEITIYTPDKYSKDEEFYEKYALGKLLLQTKYTDIMLTKKPVAYKNYGYVPDMIVKIKNQCFKISTKIEKLKKC